MKKINKDFEISSGNVFADLELPNSGERLAKAELACQINALIKEKKLTQAQAARLLDVDQPKISDLNLGKLSGFSLERLFKFLNMLDQDITIKVTPRKTSRKKASVSVTTALKKLPLKKQPEATSRASLSAKSKKN